jgi:hypothetical protein
LLENLPSNLLYHESSFLVTIVHPFQGNCGSDLQGICSVIIYIKTQHESDGSRTNRR